MGFYVCVVYIFGLEMLIVYCVVKEIHEKYRNRVKFSNQNYISYSQRSGRETGHIFCTLILFSIIQEQILQFVICECQLSVSRLCVCFFFSSIAHSKRCCEFSFSIRFLPWVVNLPLFLEQRNPQLSFTKIELSVEITWKVFSVFLQQCEHVLNKCIRSFIRFI